MAVSYFRWLLVACEGKGRSGGVYEFGEKVTIVRKRERVSVKNPKLLFKE